VTIHSSPARRLAVAFAVTERDAQIVLDRLDGDERHAEMLLLYAARWHCSPNTALENFGSLGDACDVHKGLDIWAASVEGTTALTAWQITKPLGPLRLRITLAAMRDMSERMLHDFEANFAAARAAIRKETGL
jgi:hypothetical protein